MAKFPPTSAEYGCVKVNLGDHLCIGFLSLRPYSVVLCTANLGATDTTPGHPYLKHCFAKIMDKNGKLIDTLAYGKQGADQEPYPDVDSASCELLIDQVSQVQLNQLYTEFRQLANTPYSWGVNDCCSVLKNTVQSVFNSPQINGLLQAERRLRHHRNIYPQLI